MPEEDVMQFLMEWSQARSGVDDVVEQLCRHKEGKCSESKYPCVWCALDG